MKFKNILVILIFLGILAVVVVGIFLNSNTFFVNGTIIVGWLLFVTQYVMNNYEQVYKFKERCKLWIINNSNRWNFQFEFTSKDLNLTSLLEMLDYKIGIDKNITLNKSRNIINLKNGLKLDISKSDNDVIVLVVEDLIVPYRESQKIIDNSIKSIIDNIWRETNVKNEKYHFDLFFAKNNPYYNYFVKKNKDKNRISDFYLEFIYDNVTVSMNEKQITLYSKDFTELSDTTKRYLKMATISHD